jgi:hypothetical protein
VYGDGDWHEIGHSTDHAADVEFEFEEIRRRA